MVLGVMLIICLKLLRMRISGFWFVSVCFSCWDSFSGVWFVIKEMFRVLVIVFMIFVSVEVLFKLQN